MKKNTSTKNSNNKKSKAVKNTAAPKTNARTAECKQCFNPWSLSIYVYWFIILFFIAATFYILGRSHGVLNPNAKSDEVVEMVAGQQSGSNVEITEEALLQPNDYYQSGKEKLLSGNIDDAIADLTAAIESGNASVDAYILRGEAYMQSADYRRAMADFDTAIEQDAVNSVAYYDRALLNTRLEDYSAALNDINNALASRASNPNDILQLRDLYAKRGQLNLWLKNWEGAIADYTNSLARPDGAVNPTVYAERAEAYTAIGNYAAAINDYTSAVRVISEQIQGASTIAEREDLSSRAMAYFEKSAALNLSLGNIDSARSDLESAHTIAVALNDSDSIERLQGLISEMQQ